MCMSINPQVGTVSFDIEHFVIQDVYVARRNRLEPIGDSNVLVVELMVSGHVNNRHI